MLPTWEGSIREGRGMPTLITTIGGATSNSYVTHEEANDYFESRVPLPIPWVTSGQEAALIMSARVLDLLAQPFKTFVPGTGCGCGYYRVRRQWTGSPATITQRMAWPRVGMFDANGNPLDISIVDSSVANPTVVTTNAVNRVQSGQEVLIFGHVGSDPDLNAAHIATPVTATSFSVPVNVLTGGIGGSVTTIPQELKNAQSELAGQLLMADRTLDNDVIVQGIKSIRAGSVSVTFGDALVQQVIPQAVFDMLPVGWLTDELFIPAVPAMFDVVSR